MPRYAIISDIHANLHALCAVMEHALQQQGCDCVACLGDIVGYNAYPNECAAYIRSLQCPIVRGNHDEEVCSTDWGRMNPIARQAMEWTRSQLEPDHLIWLSRLPYQKLVDSRFTIVHAGLDQPKAWNYIINADDAGASLQRQFSPICFHGHTHVPRVYRRSNGLRAEEDSEARATLAAKGCVCIRPEPACKYFINVGAVGQPRDGDPRASYAVYDSDEGCITLFRIDYDIASAQQAILAAGLPAFLAERLAQGA
ncbi:MAG: metallophosphoesterase family protein [Akkermansia sp.]